MDLIRINIQKYTQDVIVKKLKAVIPTAAEEDIIAFYQEMSSKYMQVILDKDSGQVHICMAPDGSWLLTSYFLKEVPDLEKEYETALSNMKDDTVDNAISIDSILDKIGNLGYESLTRKERKILDGYSNKN